MTSPIRISGFSSGLDIDSMVSKLMTAERLPLDKLKQNKQVLEWQRDDYRSMNTLLLSFRTDAFNMKLTSTYRTKTITSSDDTKVSATASTSAGNTSYSISAVSKLASAATIAGNTISGAVKIDPSKSIFANQSNYQQSSSITWKPGSVEATSITVTDGTATQYNVLPAGNPNNLAVTDLTNTSVKVNGTTYTYNPASPANPNEFSIDNTGKLTFAAPLSVGSTISVSYIADKKVDTITPTSATKTIQLSKGAIVDNSATINLDDHNGNIQNLSINTTATDTTYPNVRQLLDTGNSNAVVGTIDLETGKISMTNDVAANTTITATYKQNYFSFGMSTNTSKGVMKENFNIQGTESLNQVLQKLNDSTLGVSAFYDTFSDKVSMTRKETGNYNPSGVEMDMSSPSSSFLTSVLGLSNAETGGDNATFTINGLATERTTNTFDMSGVSITLKDTFTTAVNIGVSNNIDTTVDNIKKFVDSYNTLIGKIKDKVQETRYKNYPPLTDDQKQQLSDTQQEQWTTNAKSGMLRRDSILSSVLDKMRSNFNTSVSNPDINSKYNGMSAIGITTSPNYLEGGKLYLDESKLRQALQDDPSSVEKLFNSTGISSSQQGIAQRLYDSANSAMTSITQRAGNSYSTNQQFTIGKSINDLDTSISTFETRMQQVEDRYYRQFTAMEQAMNQANSQSTSLASMLGGGK
ncbi:flagellar filament capping protein FliD [Neobacillus sp. PS3-40]|uniref:flagellar filament capping protein FliD n=1 Tax=Neobacillus sp. PS3-40 TaxID=3070679 RepID=UPI0027E1A67D|nr:flagellar filament capping protein FliD [Neobacillus sp. PS3-40]WML46074.1 flagellar filament capping protein FliD [Neobacillus sp. PS3-40]